MQKVTLTHIGAVSLGKLLAIWTLALGLIVYLLYLLLMGVMSLLGIVSGDQNAFAGGIIAFIITAVMGLIFLVIYSIGMFIFGAVAATVYNIILGVGGGIDFDFKERS
ncbi:MAG: hypothetical protein PHY95_03885 [Candidatus ainarchaeum sp.]|nr:hypothetical protein [Candidatus ainarchaeum sp.]